MLYTIGEKIWYDACAGHGLKREKSMVWKTEEEAQQHIDEKNLTQFSVYYLEADWDNDTEIVEGKEFRILNKKIVFNNVDE